MAEGARLLSEYGDKTPSRVRISLSPPFTSDSRADTIHGVSPFSFGGVKNGGVKNILNSITPQTKKSGTVSCTVFCLR